MFGILQIWVVVAGVSLSGALITTDLVNVLMCLLAMILAATNSERLVVLGAWLAWGLVLASGAIRLWACDFPGGSTRLRIRGRMPP